MPTVEELYRNYGILADATEQVGQYIFRAPTMDQALRQALEIEDGEVLSILSRKAPSVRETIDK